MAVRDAPMVKTGIQVNKNRKFRITREEKRLRNYISQESGSKSVFMGHLQGNKVRNSILNNFDNCNHFPEK